VTSLGCDQTFPLCGAVWEVKSLGFDEAFSFCRAAWHILVVLSLSRCVLFGCCRSTGMIYAVLPFGLFWVHSSFVTLWQIFILLRRISLQYCLHSQISIFHLISLNIGHILVLEMFLIILLSGMARIHSNASRFLSGGIENMELGLGYVKIRDGILLGASKVFAVLCPFQRALQLAHVGRPKNELCPSALVAVFCFHVSALPGCVEPKTFCCSVDTSLVRTKSAFRQLSIGDLRQFSCQLLALILPSALYMYEACWNLSF
jgi:hypothetical protein